MQLLAVELDVSLCNELFEELTLRANSLEPSPTVLHRLLTSPTPLVVTEKPTPAAELRLCLSGCGDVGFDRPDSCMGDSVGDLVLRKCLRR